MNSHGCTQPGCRIAKTGPTGTQLDKEVEYSCRSVKELALLFSISSAMQKSLDLTDLMRPLLKRLFEGMQMTRGTLVILNRDRDSFLITEGIGLPRDFSAEQYLKLIDPIIRRAIEKGDSVIQPNILDWLLTDNDPKTIAKLNLDSATGLICVPVKHGDATLGTLNIERSYDPLIGWEPDLRLLGMVVALLAQAVSLRQEATENIASLRQDNMRLQKEIAHGFRPDNMIGTSGAIRTVYLHIDQVASSQTTVLIRGESGTGKELIAKAIHEKSNRSQKAFVKFNCAALADSIIESELFGHEKGAFTGALSMRKGRFELANGGTIFLDEIGDISLSTQVKLLRVLQEREYERVGGQTTLKTDVRIIAATSRDLEAMLEQGTFREDLYYRINVFPIFMPPLRERRCDILLLCDYFIEKYSSRVGVKPVRISSAAIDLLMSYHWPGNVRELENCIERAVLVARGHSIKAHHLPPTLQGKDSVEKSTQATLEDAMEALEREMIVDTLKETNSNMAEAARRLGITERKIGLRVAKYGIDPKRFKS
jgi:Nif-specific regulatory protein